MAKYQEQSITGEKWVRSNAVRISNPYQGTPTITFLEEEVSHLSDGRMVNAQLAGIAEPFSDPSKTFPLVNPVTGESLGATASYQDVYVLLHSLYIALATARDNA